VELYNNVYQIQSLYGGRNLFQYLFKGENTILVDTGISETPDRVIFPYMERVGLAPRELTLSVTTHADLDHQGGNDNIKRTSPGTLLACGEGDRELIENPQVLFDQRYNFLHKEHGVGFDPEASPEAGRPRAMDISFTGGEKIRLGDAWNLEVLCAPGHSRGHLALYDPKHKTAFVGDAIHGRGCPKAEGGMAIPVTYYYVDVYLSTLRYFESLPIDYLYSGHWPAMEGEEVGDFISQSRQTVEFLDRVILASLSKQPRGHTLKDLIDCVSNAIGEWPKEGWNIAMFSVKGHMDRLEELHKVRRIRGHRHVTWVST
jgi:glyoxylase-like metal-dependent hydrolase (beta-lactamase superfamily II)